MKQPRKPSAERNSKTPGEAPAATSLSDTLPPPPRKFRGRIGTLYTDSRADVPAMPGAPAGAPNVLLILLDDVGFGHTSTFGGPVNTPTLQRLADEGLRYNRLDRPLRDAIDRARLVDVSEKAFEELAAETKAAMGRIAMGTQ